MIPISIGALADVVEGKLHFVPHPEHCIDCVSTDTRNIEMGSAFFALTGVRFDGHDFIEKAIKLGAVVVVVSELSSLPLPQVVVSDVECALGKLGHWVRLQVSTKIVALTGSSGKTSVKEMTAAILKHCGRTHYTHGNLNNTIGVPLTLLQLTPEDNYAVIELGANHKNEIAYTVKLTDPQSVLVNNIAAAHLEGFGSLSGVAEAKGEIFLGLPKKGGTAIMNRESYSPKWLDSLAHQNVHFFSLHSAKADYYASDIIASGTKTTFVLHTPQSTFRITLPLVGMHNVTNAIAAAALAESVGASQKAIIEGLLTLIPVKGRLYPIVLNKTQRIFDDTYNANMGSMTAAISVLASEPGYRVLVVGDMGELGTTAAECHTEIGKVAKDARIDCVLSFGHLSELISNQQDVGKHFTDKTALVAHLKTLILDHPELTILIKGSRSIAMEQIIEQLLK